MYTFNEVSRDVFLYRAHCNSIVYRYDDNKVAVIDTGIDKGHAKKLLDAISAHGFEITHILNTHYHADHTGGNKYLSEKSGAAVYLNGIEGDIIKNPILNLRLLTGGMPQKSQLNKFFLSDGAERFTTELPTGIIRHSFPGHSLDMAVFELPGSVFCLGDLYVEERVASKYKVIHLCDIKSHLESLNRAKELSGNIFIPSHGDMVSDINSVVDANIKSVEEIIDTIKSICQNAINIDEILKQLFDKYSLSLEVLQYSTCMTTLRSYLSYLTDKGEITCNYEDNKQLFKTV